MWTPVFGLLTMILAEPSSLSTQQDETEAEVILECTVKTDRRVGHCLVLKEQPSGRGIGEHTARLIERDARVRDADKKAGDKIKMRFVFKLEAETEAQNTKTRE